MGWSCASDAARTMDEMVRGCVAASGQSNCYTSGGHRYFWETSRLEHTDGAITGGIFKILPNERCRRVGSFRIEPDGTISRAPSGLKAMAVAGTRRG